MARKTSRNNISKNFAFVLILGVSLGIGMLFDIATGNVTANGITSMQFEQIYSGETTLSKGNIISLYYNSDGVSAGTLFAYIEDTDLTTVATHPKSAVISVGYDGMGSFPAQTITLQTNDKTEKIYIPALQTSSSSAKLRLYVADDGSTYYRDDDKDGTGKTNSFSASVTNNLLARSAPILKPLQCGTSGDVNGDKFISDDDANTIANYIVNLTTLSSNALENADVTGDGKVSAIDSLAIGQYVAGTRVQLPICTELSIVSVVSNNPFENTKNLMIETRDKSNASTFHKTGEWVKATNSFSALINTYKPATEILAIGANARNDSSLIIPKQTLTMTFSNNQVLNVYIPHIEVPAGKFVRLYASANGTLYYMHPSKFGPATPYSALQIVSSSATLQRQLVTATYMQISSAQTTYDTTDDIYIYTDVDESNDGTVVARLDMTDRFTDYAVPIPSDATLSVGYDGIGSFPEQTITLQTSTGEKKIYLPAITTTSQYAKFRLYVSNDGSTYYRDKDHDGTGQEYPFSDSLDRNMIARSASAPVAQATSTGLLKIISISSTNSNSNSKAITFFIFDKQDPLVGRSIGDLSRSNLFTFRTGVSPDYNPATDAIVMGMTAPASQPAVLAEQILTIGLSNGSAPNYIPSFVTIKAYVPEVEIPAGEIVRLYINSDGSTYFQYTNKHNNATAVYENLLGLGTILSDPGLMSTQFAAGPPVITETIAITDSQSGSSGSGSGSGSGTSTTRIIRGLKTGIVSTAAFTDDVIKEIGITPARNVDTLTISARSTITQASYLSAPGIVYRYIIVDHQNADSDFSSASLKFDVSKAWIDAQGAGTDSIKLFRYSNSQWIELPTIIEAQTSSIKYTYKATSPGLSMFAISYVESTPVINNIPANNDNDIGIVPENVDNTQTSSDTIVNQDEKKLSIDFLMLVALVAIILIVVIAYIILKK